MAQITINGQTPDTRAYLVKVGDIAPDFTIRYMDGKTEQLSQHKGKIVMLQFTASWCGVCRKEMPHIEKEIWQKHKNNPKFLLLGIDFKEDRDKLDLLISKTNITYPLVFDTSGSIFHQYAEKNAGVTRNVIIDEQGKIIFLTRLFEEKEFNAMVKLLNSKLSK